MKKIRLPIRIVPTEFGYTLFIDGKPIVSTDDFSFCLRAMRKFI